MLERVWRVKPAMPPSERQTIGMNSVWKNFFAPTIHGQLKPIAGKSCRLMQKKYISTIAMKNCGRQLSVLATRVITVSTQVLRLTAETMPRATPIGTLISIVRIEKKRVYGIRARMTSITGML